jgi:hypothetical protein
MLQRRGGSSRKEHALAWAKALAIIVIRDNPTLAARGLRLVSSQLQDVEVKQLKTTGETRERSAMSASRAARSTSKGGSKTPARSTRLSSSPAMR